MKLRSRLIGGLAALAFAGAVSAQTYTPNSNDWLTIQNHAFSNYRVNAFTYIQAAAGSGGGIVTLSGNNAFTGNNTFAGTSGFNGVATFGNVDFKLLGTSTGLTLLKSGLTSTSSNTLILPTETSDTLVDLTGSQTLTNKTLTSPTLTTPALGVATATSVNGVTIPSATDTAALLGTGQTFSAANVFSLSLNNTGLNELGGVIVSEGTVTPTATVGGSGSPTASLTQHAGSKVMEFTLASASSATNIVVTPGYTAAHGFACYGNDVTTTTERLFNNAALSTTTATLTFYNAAGSATSPGATDVIVVDCDSF